MNNLTETQKIDWMDPYTGVYQGMTAPLSQYRYFDFSLDVRTVRVIQDTYLPGANNMRWVWLSALRNIRSNPALRSALAEVKALAREERENVRKIRARLELAPTQLPA